MPDINDPGATHFYGDGCDDEHGHNVPLVNVLNDDQRVNYLANHIVLPRDLYAGSVIEFHSDIDITTVNVFWAGGVYKLVPADPGDDYDTYPDVVGHPNDD